MQVHDVDRNKNKTVEVTAKEKGAVGIVTSMVYFSRETYPMSSH